MSDDEVVEGDEVCEICTAEFADYECVDCGVYACNECDCYCEETETP